MISLPLLLTSPMLFPTSHQVATSFLSEQALTPVTGQHVDSVR